MTTILHELYLHPTFKIKAGSIVSLALPERKNPVRVQVTRIFAKDDDVFVEAIKYRTNLYGIHNARVYRDLGTLIKF